MRDISYGILLSASALLSTSCGSDGSTAAQSSALSFSLASLSASAGAVDTLAIEVGSRAIPRSSAQWTSSDASVVQVNNGIATAVSPGSAQITASANGLTGSLSVTVAPDLDPAGFIPPLTDSVPVASVFDHDLPFEFSDTNGFLLSFWGEKLSGIDGHSGYDWPVPEGTPVLAAGPGTVTFATSEAPFFCPLLNATVSGLVVTVTHGLSNREVVATQYLHLSRIDVKLGARVKAGQQLGLSGTTGCSTGPHLHFGVVRINSKTGAQAVMDPYGWAATSADPWAANAQGTASFAIWSGASVPPLFKDLHRVGAYPKPAFVAIKTVRYAGIDDDHHPNNEFVEFDVNPDLPTWDFGADTLKNLQGAMFVFPSHFTLPGGATVRIYSGSGTSSSTTLYAGRSTPAWGNLGDCLRLVDTLKRTLTGTPWGNISSATCGSLANSLGPSPEVRDMDSPRVIGPRSLFPPRAP
jgi:murein DD-endopeptidase MepM/ murein hydrolase activator NlpD